jgi:hypothetical protein
MGRERRVQDEHIMSAFSPPLEVFGRRPCRVPHASPSWRPGRHPKTFTFATQRIAAKTLLLSNTMPNEASNGGSGMRRSSTTFGSAESPDQDSASVEKLLRRSFTAPQEAAVFPGAASHCLQLRPRSYRWCTAIEGPLFYCRKFQEGQGPCNAFRAFSRRRACN